MWGSAANLTDVMVGVFRHIFVVSNARSALLQTAYYGAYFTLAIPASFINRRFGYKTGDGAEGTVEVQAQGDLLRPLHQPCRLLGDRGAGAHGVRPSETSRSWPGASSTVWSRTRTLMGAATPGREPSRMWSGARATSMRWPR